MARKFPPRGYTQQQYPLPHNFGYGGQLQLEDETKNTLIATILRTSELAVGADAIEVNPSNAAFGEDTGPVIHNGSIVPRINMTLTMKLSKVAIETDKIRNVLVNWMPIYIAFLNNLEAEDSRTAVQVEDILELQHDVTNKDTYPLHGTVDASSIFLQPLSTKPYVEAYTDYGLTADAKPEYVAFDKELFYDALQYYTNSSMLKKSVGRMRTVVLTQNNVYRFHSNNFTSPIVKRGNPYTFCGVLLHAPQGNQKDQLVNAADTTPLNHIDYRMNIRFDEWNPTFDQQAY